MVSSVCSHVSFVHTFCNLIVLLKWLSVVPRCSSSFPPDLRRMSNVIAWPGSSRGMLMELFGSLPLEAGGMDLMSEEGRLLQVSAEYLFQANGGFRLHHHAGPVKPILLYQTDING